jgi:dTDP-4-amino-4,6-dideoxygalactose transaminase
MQGVTGLGVQTRAYYRTPLHRQGAMALWGQGVELPVTDELARSNFALPMSPVLGAAGAMRVVDAVSAAVAALD